MAAQEMPGGGNSRGPEYSTGAGEVQVQVMPHDNIRGAASAEGTEGVRKAFDATNAPKPGDPAPVTDEERKGTSSTDMEPEPALGVGTSNSKGAEEQAPDRTDVDTKDGRPVGTASPGQGRAG